MFYLDYKGLNSKSQEVFGNWDILGYAYGRSVLGSKDLGKIPLFDQDVYATTAHFVTSLGHDVVRVGQVGLSRADEKHCPTHSSVGIRRVQTQSLCSGWPSICRAVVARNETLTIVLTPGQSYGRITPEAMMEPSKRRA
jgi:hypothetical protein